MRPIKFAKISRPAIWASLITSVMFAANCGNPHRKFLKSGDKNQDRVKPEVFEVDDTPVDQASLNTTDTTPEHLVCRRAPGSNLIGVMSYLSPKGEVRLGSFSSNGNVAACEMARRAARKGVTCVESSGGYSAINMVTRATIKSFSGKIDDCLAYTQVRDSRALNDAAPQFIDRKELSAYLKNMPAVSDAQINGALKSQDTIWYDEDSMVFAYQDSFGNPTGPEGLRANRVAYDVGSTAAEPDIKALTEYFELQTFKYPFSITAGRLDRDNAQAVYFWLPPRDATGKQLPVAYWKNGSHWHWVFPTGTIFGELLLVRDSGTDSEWYVHEVRSRVRETNRWRTDIFRPFPKATDFATAIKKYRANWQETDLKQLVTHLEDNSTLVAGRLDSKSYEKAVPSIDGYYDRLPATKDYALIRTLLRKTVFQSAMNAEWKRSGDKVSYAPATSANFHIVPKKFIAGLLKNDETSCMRCHNQTGRPLGQLDSRAILYGEIWGEDQIFTWHPYKIVPEMYSVSDRSRIANPKLVKAGLLIEKKPTTNDPVYRELTRAYSPIYK